MIKAPKGSHYVLFSNEELELLVHTLGSSIEEWGDHEGEKEALKNDISMVLAGVL